MVSRRCKMMVKSELDKLGILYKSIELGKKFPLRKRKNLEDL